MYDATDNPITEEEIIAAVYAMLAERDALRAELDELRTGVGNPTPADEPVAAEEIAVFTMDDIPNGRGWIFVEDARTLAVSPDLDEDRKAALLAQVEQPTLTTCEVCGAPVWSNATCRMH